MELVAEQGKMAWSTPAVEEMGVSSTMGGIIDNTTEAFIVTGPNAGKDAGVGSYPNP